MQEKRDTRIRFHALLCISRGHISTSVLVLLGNYPILSYPSLANHVQCLEMEMILLRS